MTQPESPTCPTCGRSIDGHDHERDRHVRFRLPAPVLATERQERAEGSWMSHDSATDSVHLQVPGVGSFVRCLLPLRLDDGSTVTFGVWVAAAPEAFEYAIRAWWDEEAYPALDVDGWLANTVPVLGGLSAPVHAVVLDPEHTPTIVDSPDPVTSEMLAIEWPAQQVIDALPR